MKLDTDGKVEGGGDAQGDTNVNVIVTDTEGISPEGKLDACVGGQGDSNIHVIQNGTDEAHGKSRKVGLQNVTYKNCNIMFACVCY